MYPVVPAATRTRLTATARPPRRLASAVLISALMDFKRKNPHLRRDAKQSFTPPMNFSAHIFTSWRSALASDVSTHWRKCAVRLRGRLEPGQGQSVKQCFCPARLSKCHAPSETGLRCAAILAWEPTPSEQCTFLFCRLFYRLQSLERTGTFLARNADEEGRQGFAPCGEQSVGKD
jgi:hypothetical protein